MSADRKATHMDAPYKWPKPPLANSYWVEPGRLLAGEYPAGGSLAETTERLQKLLAAGVTLFLDLTADGEVSAYDALFDYVQGERVIQHVRHRIKDHNVPESPQVMQKILDTIDMHVSERGVVYVHCRAGIGRTGTVVGCYLIRCGLEPDAALERMNDLWAECERSRTWPAIPETDAQIEFIRAWAHVDPKVSAERTQTTAKINHYAGAVLGLAVGDAIGAGVVPLPPTAAPNATVTPVKGMTGGGPHSVPAGAWLSDTAMFWCLAESMLSKGGSDPQDQMERYLSWQRDGQYASTDVPLALPVEVGKALAQWQWSRKPIAGSHDPNNRDAHALARTLAAVLFFARDPAKVLVEAGESARTTLQSPIALDANRAFAVAVLDALSGADKDALLSFKRTDNAQRLRQNRLKPPVTQVMDGWWRGPAPPARMGRDALAVFSTALWAFAQTDNFHDGVLLAVNSSAAPSSAGAVYGAIAGAFYGMRSIPKEWRGAVLKADALMDVAQRLAAR